MNDESSSSAPKVTRRQALAVSALVAAAGTTGVGLRAASWWDAPRAQELRCLSEREAQIVDSMAEALFPPGGTPELSGADAGISRFLDGVVDSIPASTDNLLRLFINALDDFTRLTRFSGYCELPLAERTELLGTWAQSPQYLFRSSVSSLLLFISMGYCLHPQVQEDCGWIFPCGYGG
jgi:hypothetical protein